MPKKFETYFDLPEKEISYQGTRKTRKKLMHMLHGGKYSPETEKQLKQLAFERRNKKGFIRREMIPPSESDFYTEKKIYLKGKKEK